MLIGELYTRKIDVTWHFDLHAALSSDLQGCHLGSATCARGEQTQVFRKGLGLRNVTVRPAKEKTRKKKESKGGTLM